MKKNNKLAPSIIISLILHSLLLVALLWGADFTMSKPKPGGNLVQTVVIDPALVKKQANDIRRQRQLAEKKEQERLDKLRREAEQLEKNRKAEEARIRKLKQEKAKADKAAREAEKKAREAKKKREAEEKRRKERAAKAEADRKKQQQEAALRKAEQERKDKEAAEKERLEKEKAAKEAREKARKEQQRLKRLERERKEQEAALNDIFAGLDAEAAQNSSAQQQFTRSEVDRYGEIYKQRIQSNLRVEESFSGKSCRINLKLLPTGKDAIVSSVKVLGGDSQLCAATQRAVAQVASFPLPGDQGIVNKLRDINLTVEL